MVDRVIATDATLALIDKLKHKHGPELIFHQSGGCCDGSAANCYLKGELNTDHDVLLGEIGGCPFYMSPSQYEYWKHTQLIIDVLEARGGGTFSLEGPEGVSFHTRSRLFSDAEWAELEAAGKV